MLVEKYYRIIIELSNYYLVIELLLSYRIIIELSNYYLVIEFNNNLLIKYVKCIDI